MSESAFKYLSGVQMTARNHLVPTCVMLELTPRCSLDCKMCYVHLTNEQMKGKKELSGEQWKKIIDDFVELGAFDFLLTGGECMMHPDFKDIYLYLLTKPVFVTINSNATLFNDEYFKFFAEHKPHKIKISLYGSSEDGYERVTGHRVYSRVLNNILKLKELGIYISLSVTVSRQMMHEAGDIIAFALEHDIEYNTDTSMVQANSDTGRHMDDYAMTADELIETLTTIRNRFGWKSFQNDVVAVEKDLLEGEPEVRSMYCSAGRSKAAVAWDGTIKPCIWFENEDCLKCNEVGVKKAWEHCNEVSHNFVLPIECTKCEYFSVCHPCPLARMDPNNPGHRNLAMCQATVARINAGFAKFEKK